MEPQPTDESNLTATMQVTPALAAGHAVGPYSLIRALGVGGMGSVYLAEDSRLERKVALKFLSSQLAQDAEFRQRFLREARSAAKLNHTNIVTVYEIGEDADRVYIAMEYVDGRSLRELIDTRALSYGQALDVFRKLCAGLKKAHDAGIMHRDLKPANVMVTAEQEVKILDFGLAKAVVDTNLTNTGTALGTVNYMSPEQAQGTPADHRSDIFSAGILLFELLAGVNPFVRGYMPATIHAIVYEPIGDLSSHKADLPQGCQAVVEKCVAKQADHRYQSVDELVADLARLEAGEAIMPAAVAQPDAPHSQKPTLAILHLRNLGSEDDEFLTYGITEDLIVDLSRLGSVKVLPMRSVLKYKDSDLNTEELAKKLGASMILDGSLHRSASNVRISAQLIDVRNEDILWSNRWEESPEKVGRIKSALAEGIGSALKVDSSVVRKVKVAASDTSNPEAYDFYLKGKFALDKRKKRADVDTARRYFEQALELEPNLLAATVGLAEVYNIDTEFEKALKVLEPALADTQNRGLVAEEALVRTVLGITLNRVVKLNASKEQLEKAIELYRQLKDAKGEARAIAALLRPLLNLYQSEEVKKYEERFGELVQAGADPANAADGLLLIGLAYDQLGDSVRSQSLFEDALQIARAHDIKPVAFEVLRQLASSHMSRGGGSLETAMAYIEEARYIAEKLDDKLALWRVELSTFFMEAVAGAFAQALAKIDRLRTMAQEMYDDIGEVSLEWAKGILLYFMGRYDEAIQQADYVKKVSARLSPKHAATRRGDALLISAVSHFMLGDSTRALELWSEGSEVLSEAGAPDSIIRGFAFGGEMLMRTGERDRARECFTQVIENSEESDDAYPRSVARGALALMDIEDGVESDAFGKLRQNVEEVAGHFAEVVARRFLGQALLEHGASDRERQDGRRTLLQALNMARKHENAVEITRIQEVLERNE